MWWKHINLKLHVLYVGDIITLLVTGIFLEPKYICNVCYKAINVLCTVLTIPYIIATLFVKISFSNDCKRSSARFKWLDDIIIMLLYIARCIQMTRLPNLKSSYLYNTKCYMRPAFWPKDAQNIQQFCYNAIGFSNHSSYFKLFKIHRWPNFDNPLGHIYKNVSI